MADDPPEPGSGATQGDDRPRARSGPTGPLEELASRARTLAFVLASLAIDLLFVALWGFLHTLFDEQVIHRLRLADFDRFSLVVFQVAFSASTLFAVGVYIAKDLVRIYHRIWDEP